ncbi:MAG: diacylglycerol kinase family lipid kinase [Nitriliruptorales bacterium]|nr:diacylglycerol kinase family lipid kinase [Nitriliruptorales bacterium]
MRALLVFNPNATTTDDDLREVIASALASQVELEVQATKQRGHATHVAAGAVHEGVDAVFVLGGDGTANEVIQALAGTEARLGVIPGGGTNVLARALGLPNDAVRATTTLLDHLRNDKIRRISLGRAAGRYFAFNAGFGFDAAVVRLVEQRTRMKRTLRQAAFVWCALEEWARGPDRTAPIVSVTPHGGTTDGPFTLATVANADPYTFLGSRPLHVTPGASFDRGLDVVGIREVGTATLLRIVGHVFGRRGAHLEHPAIAHWQDLPSLELTAAEPQPLMVDGDYAGEHTTVRVDSAPNALTVLA